MPTDNHPVAYFFLVCSGFIVLQGLQLGYGRLSKEIFSIKAAIGIFFMIHPLSIFFFGNNEVGLINNTPMQGFYDSLFFFDILALMLISIILSRPASISLWRGVLLTFIPALLFFLIAHISFSEETTIRELNVLLSLSFIIILGCIFYQGISSSHKDGLVYRRFRRNLNFLVVIAIVLWSSWVILQIQNKLDFVTPNELYFLWLAIKIILLVLVFQFNYVIDESIRMSCRDSIIKELRSTFAEASAMKTILYNFPTFLFLTDRDGNITFANKIALSNIAMSPMENRNFDSVFMDSIEEAITFSRLTYKDSNNSLHMFAVRTEKILDNEQSHCMLWMLRRIDFDFEIFCKSIINNRESFKVTGLLDHNFAIYRMSNTWRKLISPVDKFFHSGVIWDKLRAISKSYSEITHIENTISTSKRATGWLIIGTGSALVITLEKIYSPDKRLFYHLNARQILQ